MSGKWLSTTAVLWAMDDTPADLPPPLKWTLVAIARYAGEDGRGAYPAKQTLAYVTGKSARQVQRDIGELLARGLIRLGDQRLAKDIRADQRPTVYDLAMPAGNGRSGETSTTPRRRHGETSERSTGRHPSAQRGDMGVSRRVLKTPEQGASSRRSAGATRRRAPERSKSRAGQENQVCGCGTDLRQFEGDQRAACINCEAYPADCPCFPLGKLHGELILLRYLTTGTLGDQPAVGSEVHVLSGPRTGQVTETALFCGELADLLAPAANTDRPFLGRVVKRGHGYQVGPSTTKDEITAQAYLRELNGKTPA